MVKEKELERQERKYMKIGYGRKGE